MAEQTRAGDGGEVMRFLTGDGPIWIQVLDGKVRSKVARYVNALRRYLEIGDASRLVEFEGGSIETVDGQRLEFVTDLATIDRLAEGGEVWFELYRS